MARGKYIKDYRIVESLNAHGGIRTETEYIGAPYYFTRGAEEAGKTRRIALLLCLAGWAAFIGALIPSSAAMRTLYVSLPFAFAALPLFMLSDLLVTNLRVKEPMEHRTADKFENRFPALAMAAFVLPAAALVGLVIRFFVDRSTMLPGDGIFALCAALLICCGAFAFGLRKRLATRKGE